MGSTATTPVGEEASSLLVARLDGVAKIVLNRPERLNAIDCDLARRLLDALEGCERDPEVRVVVLTGSGRSFSAGGDIEEMRASVDSGTPAQLLLDVTEPLHRAVLTMRRLSKPIIGAVRGPAHGAGLALALACDIVVASEEATFCAAFAAVGASPDTGTTFFLPRLVGRQRASALILLDETVDAKQALELGLIARVAEDEKLEEVTRTIAARLARGPTTALAATKQLLERSSEHSLETQLDDERATLAAVGRTTDFAEGVRAFLEKRRPVFGTTHE